MTDIKFLLRTAAPYSIPKGEIYFEDARGIVPENLPDIDLICGVISEFGEPNSVRVFQSLESEGALKMPEERCSLKSLGLPALKDLAFCSLKTFPDSFRMTGAGRLRPSSVRWMNWGIMSHGRCITAHMRRKFRSSPIPKKSAACRISWRRIRRRNTIFHGSKPKNYCQKVWRASG